MMKQERFSASIDVIEMLANYVEVDRFLECCRECPNYGQRHTCPPYDFDVIAFWRQYSFLDVYAVRISALDSYEETEEALMDELIALEESTPGSLCLSAGNCGLKEGDRLRYSIESLGGNVDRLCRDLLGISLEWGKDGAAPERIMLVAGLLKK